MRTVAAAPALLLLLLTSCQKGSAPAASPAAGAPSSSAAESSGSPVTSDVVQQGAGKPKTDPCSLLTKSIAEGALGLAVGAGHKTVLPGNVTCAYAPADGRANVFVLLTTYAASGRAALATATKVFRDAKPVPDLGDAALVSRQAHAVGVLSGDLLFGVSLLRPDGLSVPPAVAEAQVIALARTVLRSR